MKKRIILTAIAVILLILIAIPAYVKLFLPKIPLQDINVEITPERIERGKYLANHVTVCMDCHSKRDWSLFSGPVTEGTLGAGGDRFDKSMGFPGVYYAPNLTPYNLKDWNDAEIYRAIVSGVNRDHKAMFPVMPYLGYGKMSREDIYSIIAYIRTLPEIRNDVPASKTDFPMNFIMNLIPQKENLKEIPGRDNLQAYGEYMVNAAGCIECHTPFEKGKLVMEKAFSGGREFPMITDTVYSSNISPDATGIGYWTEDAFITKFKSYNTTDKAALEMRPGMKNSIMPWTMYAGMDTIDLKAIYAYLRTVKGIENVVKK